MVCCSTACVIGQEWCFYNHDYDHPELLAVKLGGTGDITDSHIVWRIDRGSPSTPTPLLVGDELYFVSDKVSHRASMLRRQTTLDGTPWRQLLRIAVFANGHVFFLSEERTLALDQTIHYFPIVQQNEVTGRTFATPAFVDNAMFLPSPTKLC